MTIHCEWGWHGVHEAGREADILIVVDVLSFGTCVDVALGRGAQILPWRERDESAEAHAIAMEALLAEFERSLEAWSLSPTSLRTIPPGSRLVLPSLNGAALSLESSAPITLAGCLRNAWTVAEFAREAGRHIVVVPAGERWPDGTLRPALEDWLGAGAIISHLEGERTPEAQAAAEAFQLAEPYLIERLLACTSGEELCEGGFQADVELAGELDASDTVPVLHGGAFMALDDVEEELGGDEEEEDLGGEE